MGLLFLSFIAGILSVLAPCVLPVLPIILGSSLGAQKRYRPLIIVLSTGFFITFFTIILKVSSLLIGVPQVLRVTFSALIIVAYGLTLVRPELWERAAMALGITNANRLAGKAKEHKGIWGDILLGAALGPIFASCSPTYAILLSLVFPKSFALGVTYTLIYALGFSLLLLIIAYGGRAVVQKLMGAANPKGRLKKVLGVILIITGLLIATGRMQEIQTRILTGGKRDITRIEQKLINNSQIKNQNSQSNNVGTQDLASEANKDNDPRIGLLNTKYTSPEFAGLTNWINTSGRNTIKELKGKVVIIDFWTYSCINCIRTLPYVEQLYKTYASKGLVVIGVHAPEFKFEHDVQNVKDAVKKFGLTYPVVQDNDFATRRNFDNLYRPAKYIIDREGNVRYTHFGEGGYEETEQVVQYLLGLNTTGVIKDNGGTVDTKTPETYLGGARRANYSQKPSGVQNQRWLTGNRQDEDERITLAAGQGSITINAYAKEVNLVLGVDTEAVGATVYVDGKLYKKLSIDRYQLYNLMEEKIAGKHTVEIRFDAPGVMAYAYTFG